RDAVLDRQRGLWRPAQLARDRPGQRHRPSPLRAPRDPAEGPGALGTPMPLHIGRVDAEIEITRSPAAAAPATTATGEERSAGDASSGALRGRNALRERLRPIVLEILHDELTRMKRKIGAP